MDDTVTLESKARAAFQGRRYDLAAGLYGRLVELAPREAAHRIKLGDALRRLGCRLSAAASYAAAAKLFHADGDHARAASACRAALALHPADSAPRELLASLR